MSDIINAEEFGYNQSALVQKLGFVAGTKQNMRIHKHLVDRDRTNNSALVFKDGSACVFEGHDIRIVREYKG